MSERVPEAFLRVLADLAGWLESAHIPAMVIGGVAASILGRPRATRDIDALAILSEQEWTGALAAASKHGIVPRIEAPVEFARRTRVLLLRHVESAVDIDVILGRLPYEEEAIARSELHNLGGVQVKLPQVEDLLIMKAIAQRPQDLRDIEGLLDVHPNADVERVRQWVREFATAMAMPDMLEALDKLLSQRKPNRKA
jgi:predicted nucleotidyltransferase